MYAPNDTKRVPLSPTLDILLLEGSSHACQICYCYCLGHAQQMFSLSEDQEWTTARYLPCQYWLVFKKCFAKACYVDSHCPKGIYEVIHVQDIHFWLYVPMSRCWSSHSSSRYNSSVCPYVAAFSLCCHYYWLHSLWLSDKVQYTRMCSWWDFMILLHIRCTQTLQLLTYKYLLSHVNSHL